jgi:hypothetical protein
MRKNKNIVLLAAALLAGTCLLGSALPIQAAGSTLGFFFNRKPFTDTFYFDECGGFSSTGSNRYFILEPGFQIVLEGKQGKHTDQSILLVLNETKTVDGVETRILENKETRDGALTEISRNYFAICKKTNSVFYFGEDVDEYENGVIVGHAGSWQAGKNGGKAGLEMPGIILLGARFYMEVVPGVAEDKAEIVSMTETVQTPAGTFENCLKTKETSNLEMGIFYKYYAPGIGAIKDQYLELIDYGYTK